MKIFAANWKLHKNPTESRSFFNEFLAAYSGNDKVIIFPPATSLEAAGESLKGGKLEFGSQNAYCEAKGAFTGETSAQVVKDLGGKWILLGHSERRKVFGESDELIAKKFQFVQSLGLTPMLCIGETLEEREANKTKMIIESQLQKALSLLDKSKSFTIAYEPVWAIGTGKVATSAQVKEAHQFVFDALPVKVAILYGGSVKADNAKELINIPNVGGFLVGGASLEVKSFLDICNA